MKVRNFIGGEWDSAYGGGTFDSLNPADTREIVATAPLSGREDVDRGVEAARRAFFEWRRLPAPRRGEILFRAGELLLKNKRKLGALVTKEMGKVIAEG